MSQSGAFWDLFFLQFLRQNSESTTVRFFLCILDGTVWEGSLLRDCEQTVPDKTEHEIADGAESITDEEQGIDFIEENKINETIESEDE